MYTARKTMSRSRSRLPAGLISILALAATPVSADDIAGDWEMKMDLNGRVSFASLSISKKPDGTLAGQWGSNELSEVKFAGAKLSFVRTLRFGDNEFKMNYEGSLKDGALTGELSSERGSFAANGARPRPKSPVLGRWALRYSIGDRDINATLAVWEGPAGALDAKWTSETGEHVVSNVKVQDGKLSLARKSKIGDREFETTYEATAQGNKILGTIKLGGEEIPAGGNRVGADLVGRWEMTTTTDQGARRGLLTIFGDLTGRYETFVGEVPFKDLKLEGNQVSFSVEAGFGDQTFNIDFKAKLDGKTLKGEVTSPRGTREVTGKKVEPALAIVGTWEITRESNQGTRTSTLKIKDDLTGTYTARDNTFPITDLRFEGDQLSFKVTVKYEDREVPMEFKGKVEGGTLKGQFISARGPREATGKKVSPSL